MTARAFTSHVMHRQLSVSELHHPSVLLCTPEAPYNPNGSYPTKTTIGHSKTTLQSGTTYRCSNCGLTASSA